MASSDYYNHTTFPTTSSALSSSAMRSELDSITSGISAKLPDLTGNGGEILAVNAGATALEAITTTGTGSGVRATSPTLVTPVLGVATATSVNGLTITTSTGTLTITNGKTLSVSNTLTFTGTDASSVAFGTGGTVTYTSNDLSVFAATTSAQLAGVISNETGTGLAVFNDTPTLIAPLLGTPTSGVLTNCTGLPVSSGISGLAANVATFLATPSSANLISAVTDETGTGALVFANSPTLVTPALGTPSACVATNLTGTAIQLTAGGVLTNANLTGPITSTGNATAVAAQTGTGSTFVMQASPTLTTPVLGVATATSINGLTITTSTGTLTITNGKTLTNTNSITLTGTDAQTYTFPTTSATLARTDATNNFTGNQGVGVAVSTWASGSKALQIGTTTFIENNAGAATYMGFNAYRAAGGWTYLTTEHALRFGAEAGGNFVWATAPSGTAGNAVTFTDRLSLNSTGATVTGTLSATSTITTTGGDGVGVTDTNTGKVKIGRTANAAATSEIAYIESTGPNASSNAKTWTRIATVVNDATNASEDASIVLRVMKAGTIADVLNASESGVAITGTAQTSGNLGAGITPTARLHVTDSVTTRLATFNSTGSNGVALVLSNASNDFAAIGTDKWATGGLIDDLFIGTQANGDDVVIGTVGAERIRVTTTTTAAKTSVTAMSATAIPAGGTAGAGLMVSSTANFGVFFGSGAPSLSAAKGSLYLRSDGSTTNDRAYINTNGSTTWTALTTAA